MTLAYQEHLETFKYITTSNQRNFKENGYIKTLPCLHSFHLICIESWKSTQISLGKPKILCPLCKQIFDIEEEKEEE